MRQRPKPAEEKYLDGLYHYTDDRISIAWRIEGGKFVWAAPLFWWGLNKDKFQWHEWLRYAEKIESCNSVTETH